MPFRQSSLWQTTFGKIEPNHDGRLRELLLKSFIDLRDMSKSLVQNIAADLRSYTVHDVTHLDALWGIASEIAGPDYFLTPTEAFVLGGAILLHDAGMSLAAYPGGIAEIKKQSSWPIVLRRHARHLTSPTEAEERAAIVEFIRMEHASRAADLCRIKWSTANGVDYFLIEKTDLRQKFGQFIGEVAASHWWSHEKVAQKLDRIISAPPPFPTEWHIDLLKVASILRVADAAHVDERRAPGFVWALRNAELAEESRRHWLFQNRLTQPERRGDAIHYSSTADFDISDEQAWWLAYDTLRMVDAELRGTDVILADLRGESHRFAARRVANVESPTTMVKSVGVVGWIPIDTALRISDVPSLIRMLGGEALYGRDDLVPIRELVQNAADAIRLRSALEPCADATGRIRVSIGQVGGEQFLQVSDNGVGMSKEIVGGSFLDFGGSGWREDPAFLDHPEIDPNSISIIGKFGIGFFSVFMLGERVEVRTRRFDKGYEETLVLSFADGLSKRPVLRPAKPEERLTLGGTVVRVWLKRSLQIGSESRGRRIGALKRALGHLFPALDVPILLHEEGNREVLLDFGDWLTVSGQELLARINRNRSVPNWIKPYCQNIRSLFDASGRTVGRMFVAPSVPLSRSSGRNVRESDEIQIRGVVVARGIAVEDMQFCGVLEGRVVTAARDFAIPNVEFEVLRNWASEQAVLIANLKVSPEEQAVCAEFILASGGDTDHLKICETTSGWLSQFDLPAFLTSHEEVILLHDAAVSLLRRKFPKAKLNSNVIWSASGLPAIFHTRRLDVSWEFEFGLISGRGSFQNRVAGRVVADVVGRHYGLSGNEIQKYEESIVDGRDIYDSPYVVGVDAHGGSLRLGGKLYRAGMSREYFECIKREGLSKAPDSLDD
jgi:Histidine kinase-, DNA gyrase B-, and HSP90-like ATPase